MGVGGWVGDAEGDGDCDKSAEAVGRSEEAYGDAMRMGDRG